MAESSPNGYKTQWGEKREIACFQNTCTVVLKNKCLFEKRVKRINSSTKFGADWLIFVDPGVYTRSN